MPFELPTSEGAVWRPFSILVAGHHPWGARSLENALIRRGYEVVRADSAVEVFAMALGQPLDALIIDDDVSGVSGLAICRQLRGDSRFLPTTPIVLASSAGGTRDERLEAYGAGAWELVAQPMDAEVLLLKLDTFLRARSVAERWRIGNIMDDSGLYSRDALLQRAREVGNMVARRQQPWTCAILTPSLPPAPDALGAGEVFWGPAGGEPVSAEDPAGASSEELKMQNDSLVEHVARVVRMGVRTCDLLGRWSENEIALVAPGTDRTGTAVVLDRFRALLERHPLPAGHSMAGMGVRVGVASTDALQIGTDPAAMLTLAEQDLRGLLRPGPRRSLSTRMMS